MLHRELHFRPFHDLHIIDLVVHLQAWSPVYLYVCELVFNFPFSSNVSIRSKVEANFIAFQICWLKLVYFSNVKIKNIAWYVVCIIPDHYRNEVAINGSGTKKKPSTYEPRLSVQRLQLGWLKTFAISPTINTKTSTKDKRSFWRGDVVDQGFLHWV